MNKGHRPKKKKELEVEITFIKLTGGSVESKQTVGCTGYFLQKQKPPSCYSAFKIQRDFEQSHRL